MHRLLGTHRRLIRRPLRGLWRYPITTTRTSAAAASRLRFPPKIIVAVAIAIAIATGSGSRSSTSAAITGTVNGGRSIINISSTATGSKSSDGSGLGSRRGLLDLLQRQGIHLHGVTRREGHAKLIVGTVVVAPGGTPYLASTHGWSTTENDDDGGAGT